MAISKTTPVAGPVVPSRFIVSRLHAFGLIFLAALTWVAFTKISDKTGLPVHWGFDGKPDVIWPRDQALWMSPVLAVLVTALFAAFGWLAPQARLEHGRRLLENVLTGLLLLLLALQFALLLIGTNSDFDLIRILSFLVALILLGLGFTIFRAPANVYHGIHLPWTYANARNWTVAHRSFGVLMIFGGLVLGGAAAIQPGPAILLETMLGAIVVPPLLGTLVSLIFART